MARSHGVIQFSLWNNKDFRKLSAASQRMYLVLFGQKDVNNAGMLPLMPARWAKYCDETDVDHVWACLSELATRDFIVFDTDSDELLIRSFIRGDGVVKQPNVFKNALKCAELVDSPSIRIVLATELRKLRRRDADAVAEQIEPNPSETLCEPFPKGSETLPEPLNPSRTLREPHGEGVGEGVKEPNALTQVLENKHARANSNARTERDPIDIPGAVTNVDGWKLVREVIPGEHPQATKTALSIEAGTLIKTGTPIDDVKAALALWLSKPNLGPRTLPSLVSEVIRNRNPTLPVSTPPSKQDAKVQGFLALANQTTQKELE
ncbi:hypothetical protein C7T36_18335 [Rhodococcus sp. AD45-ID]|uniref:hypothetical protein n=1 Tax=unclassified Rhodococcus (in: high G+C Gram-positive bacteria) TaxID=192944 RepID=UPI0005E60E04|nr:MULTISPECIES: hypothetical protein [unclassified Rhodococcus (in: high G+C Gram-positive bacteria)]KJF21939.1 hypothetical protein SZ00_02583 [Rhodococcus sp. AD45]PSR39637.1 hypothetical protein C7T36_18335 [Rhodococcus sp. AD45-ID]